MGHISADTIYDTIANELHYAEEDDATTANVLYQVAQSLAQFRDDPQMAAELAQRGIDLRHDLQPERELTPDGQEPGVYSGARAKTDPRTGGTLLYLASNRGCEFSVLVF